MRFRPPPLGVLVAWSVAAVAHLEAESSFGAVVALSENDQLEELVLGVKDGGKGGSLQLNVQELISDPAPACDASTNNTCGAGQFGCEDAGCVDCPVGRFSTNYSFACANCTSGKTSPAASKHAKDCKACELGQTALAGGACTDCEAGRFAAPGKGGAECDECPVGRWSATKASNCTACPAGKSSMLGKAESDCKDCVAGRFSLAGGNCTICAAGTSSVAGSSSCEACPAGKHYNMTLSICKPCEKGTYMATAGGQECAYCDAGKIAAAEGSVSCTACPSGKSSDVGTTECKVLANSTKSTEAFTEDEFLV